MAYILLADDDPLLGELVQYKLEGSGHRVDIVGDGEAAMAAIAHQQPDLLILDSMMPAMSGHEVLQQLKASPDTAAIPIIMLTARKGQENVVSALQAGADDYVTKPFMPDEFLARVRTVLAKFGVTGNAA